MISRVASFTAWLLLALAFLFYLRHKEVLRNDTLQSISLAEQKFLYDGKTNPLIFLSISAFVLINLSLVKKADPSIFNYPIRAKKEDTTFIHSILLELISMIQLWIGGLALLLSKQATLKNLESMHSFWFYISLIVFLVVVYIIRMQKHQKN